MDDHELLERIDACRPDSPDYRDAELAPLAEELTAHAEARHLYQRVQRLDGAMGQALADVPVPEGLQERLLERLAAERVAASDLQVQIPEAAAAEEPEVLVEKSEPRQSRRSWLWTAVALSSAASLAAAAFLSQGFLSGEPELTLAKVQDEAIGFYNSEQPEPGFDPARVPAPEPISGAVRYERYTWRKVENFLGRPHLDGLAFELSQRGTSATLYVLRAPALGLPMAPPRQPGLFTANRSVSAWQENGLMYVLVVDGGERAYQSVVRRPPLA